MRPHKLPGFDRYILGLTERPGQDQVITYDLEKVLKRLRREFKTDRAGAVQRLDDMLRGVTPECMPAFLSYTSTEQIDAIYKQGTM